MEEKKNNENRRSEKPITSFLLFVSLFAAVVGVCLLIFGLSDDEIVATAIGGVLTVLGVIMFIAGLAPYVAKLKAQYNQEVLGHAGKDITKEQEMTADTYVPATKKVARALKEGFSDEEEKTADQKYCSECGKLIDRNAKFCEHCGTKQ